LKIAILGPAGTYSERAAKAFAHRIGIKPGQLELIYTTINDSLRRVQNNQADYAVIPVENMIDGLIGTSLDALLEYQDFVKVCDEVHLPITHVLAIHPEGDWEKINRIYSHPSALNQCQRTLAELLPDAELIPVSSTAEAAGKVQQDPHRQSAAICNHEAAKLENLKIVDREIQDYLVNETRFMVCALHDGLPTGNDRTLMAVRYGTNQPGQLYQTAKYLAEQELDLTFVQSRPYKVKPQEYVLIYEFVGHRSDPKVEQALKNIEMQVRTTDGWKKILGSYPKREREEEKNGI